MTPDLKELILAGAEQQGDDDKDYRIGTPEAYKEFVKKRNYKYSDTEHLEWDNWKPIE
jgi:hypothetical protein